MLLMKVMTVFKKIKLLKTFHHFRFLPMYLIFGIIEGSCILLFTSLNLL